jgi:hypothetical protein
VVSGGGMKQANPLFTNQLQEIERITPIRTPKMATPDRGLHYHHAPRPGAMHQRPTEYWVTFGEPKSASDSLGNGTGNVTSLAHRSLPAPQRFHNCSLSGEKVPHTKVSRTSPPCW